MMLGKYKLSSFYENELFQFYYFQGGKNEDQN